MTQSACALLTLTALLGFAPPNSPTLTLAEHFGVSHPDQLVFFDVPPEVSRSPFVVTDEQLHQVPAQAMSNGQVAIRTSLPAGTSRTWRITPGQPSNYHDAVTLVRSPDALEISNGLLSIRLPSVPNDLTRTPAPIQGLRYRDGTWTATGPNWMPRPAKAMRVDVLEMGPLLIRVRLTYAYDRLLLHSSRPELPDVPAGEGQYSTTIEVQAGQPSILFEEESDLDISYQVNITSGLEPDQARYCGHHATAPSAGMELDGTVFDARNHRHDALVKLNYLDRTKNALSQTTYPFVSHWDPWSVNTGYYWQLYASGSGGSDHLLGVFAGPASRLLSPGSSGISFDTTTKDGKPEAALQVRFQRLLPTQFYSTHMRFAWGLLLGRKNTDLRSPQDEQEINRQFNIHSGVTLTKLAQLPATYPDPASGHRELYAPAAAWRRIAEGLRDEHARGGRRLYNEQLGLNPHLKPILDYWAAPSPSTLAAPVDQVTSFARDYLETLVNGRGLHDNAYGYFMGAMKMSSYTTWIYLLLDSDQLSPELKVQLKRVAALFCAMLWDNALAPMQKDSGMNLGPANMASMWLGTRNTLTLFLANDPNFSGRVDSIRQEATTLLHTYLNDAGACNAGAHYAGASMVPILNLLQQLQMNQVVDTFSSDPLIDRYAEWEMQLLTPPEVRFGGLRKIIAVGDGSTEQSVRLGQLATGLARSHPSLSARLMGAWRSMGSPQDDFFGPSVLKIDPALPSVSPGLGDAHFKGWLSVLRSGWDTRDESAVYFINGDALIDHRHDDQGEVIIYALGAPLSLDFGSMYYPRPSGGLMHSIALPESALGRPWDADHVPLDTPSDGCGLSSWWDTQAAPPAFFLDSASASARFRKNDRSKDMAWKRTVRLLRPDSTHPVVVIDDGFSGSDLAGKPVVSTLNLMASGQVETPRGVMTPQERTHQASQKTALDELPSVGPVLELKPGLNRFGFSGQWEIDWDLYVESPAQLQATLGNWGHRWHPTVEQVQFAKAQGRPFEERQHILRLRYKDRSRMIILPYRKGQRPSPLAVERQGDATIIREGTITLNLLDHGYTSVSPTRRSLTAFGSESVQGLGMAIHDGPAEIVLEGASGTLSLSGKAGPRRITLPSSWVVVGHMPMESKKTDWLLDYPGSSNSLRVELKKVR